MKNWLIAVAACAVIVAIPTAYASTSNDKPSAQGASHSQDPEKNAAKACKAERTALGADAFAKKYGTNKNLRNAFGKCVSSKAKGDEAKGKDDDDKSDENDGDHGGEGNKDNAAKACKSERASLGADAFAKKYGTNHNLHNAFGKCVSTKAKAHGGSNDDD